MLSVMGSIAEQVEMIDCELRRLAKEDERLKAADGAWLFLRGGPLLRRWVLPPPGWAVGAVAGSCQRA